MRVKDLIEELNLVDQNAIVVINNQMPLGIRVENGRDKIGHMNDSWLPLVGGNRTALRFSYLTESSDGSIIERYY